MLSCGYPNARIGGGGRSKGKQSSPWSARVTFHVTPGAVITIVASTGGDVAAVERFAVTGAHAR